MSSDEREVRKQKALEGIERELHSIRHDPTSPESMQAKAICEIADAVKSINGCLGFIALALVVLIVTLIIIGGKL